MDGVTAVRRMAQLVTTLARHRNERGLPKTVRIVETVET